VLAVRQKGRIMRKVPLFILLLAVVLVPSLWALSYYNSVSATDASTTLIFQGQRSGVLLCNSGANPVFFVLFNDIDTQRAATSSDAPIAVGDCVGFSKSQTEPAFYKAASFICGAGLTATVRVYSD
jgi:hypothetical protein